METLVLEAVDYQDAAHWRWRLTTEGGAFIADHPVALDTNAVEYQGFIDLHGFLLHRADPGNRLASEAELVDRVGRWLGERALGPIGPTLVARSPATVRVRVPAGAEALLQRPFELTHVDGRPLALQDVSLVFEPAGGVAGGRAPVGERLRMLAVFSVPTDVSALALRRERYRLSRLVHEIAVREGRALEMRVLQYGASRERLTEVLEEGEGWDAVHFSGHGLAGGLVLEREDGSQERVETGELVGLLRPARERLKLVTLSSCLSAAATAAETLRLLGITPPRAVEARETPEAAEALPALAQELTGRLGCAVLAMRYPVDDDFAIALSEALYELLLGKGNPLPRALQLALARSVRRPPEPGCPAISVATPALFGALAAGLRLSPPKGQAPAFDPDELRTAGFPPEPERFVGRVGALARASAALAPRSGHSGVLFHGMAGGGKTTCALELVYRHQESFRAIAWYKAPDQSADIARSLIEFALALEARVPRLELAHRVDQREELESFLPVLRRFLEREAVLVVVDNLEGLLTPEGRWRDERWGLVVGALSGHRGLSRLVLTSRVRPEGLDPGMLVETIHALTLEESVLLARELPGLGGLMRSDEGRALVVRTLAVVRGHPKLIELADAAAKDVEGLRRRLEEAERGLSAGQLRSFFERGESEATAEEHLRVLEGWARGALSGLGEASATLFGFLCGLEEADRVHGIVRENWGDLRRRLGRAEEEPDVEAALGPLVERALVEVVAEGEDPDLRVYRLHPAIVGVGRAEAEAGLQAAVDRELADSWLAVFEHGLGQQGGEAGGQVVDSARRAVPYLVRLQEWDAASFMIEQVINRDRSPATLAALLPTLRGIVEATTGTEAELAAAGTLARALQRQWAGGGGGAAPRGHRARPGRRGPRARLGSGR